MVCLTKSNLQELEMWLFFFYNYGEALENMFKWRANCSQIDVEIEINKLYHTPSEKDEQGMET